MENRYGKMRQYDEPDAMMTFSMESNMMKIHRKYPKSNSRKVTEAILLAMHCINGYLTGSKEDVEKFESEDNLRLKNAILMAFDPFTNDSVREVLGQNDKVNLEDSAFLEMYYKESVRCLLKLYKSVELWIDRYGSDGYFVFVENFMGSKVKSGDKMEFTILLPAV